MHDEKADRISDTEIIDRMTEIIKTQADLIRELRNTLAMHGINVKSLDQKIERVRKEAQNGFTGIM